MIAWSTVAFTDGEPPPSATLLDRTRRRIYVPRTRRTPGSPLSAEEVERAVALITTDIVISLQSAQNRADKLSQFATYLGDPGLVNAQIELFQRVSSADVFRFARERMGRDNRASLLYVPRDGAETTAEVVA